MSDDGPAIERTASPDEAFELLADGTRLDVVRALQDAEEPLRFSELRERVGVRDSGQFNYHLDKLRGHLVRKSDEGYELTHAGFRTVAAILSGAYTHAAHLDPVAVDGECFECGAGLELRYDDETMSVGCSDCETVVLSHPVPPVVLRGREPERLAGAFEEWVRANFDFVRRGFCPFCSGSVDHEVTTMDLEWAEGAGVVSTCRECGMERTSSLGAALLDHPAVIAFHHERGVDLRETRLWNLDWLGEYGTVESEDPLRASVGVELDGDELVLTVDGDLEVVDAERPTA